MFVYQAFFLSRMELLVLLYAIEQFVDRDMQPHGRTGFHENCVSGSFCKAFRIVR